MKKILFIFPLLILNIAVCNAEDTVITLKMYSCKSRTPDPIWFNYYPERSAEQTCMPLGPASSSDEYYKTTPDFTSCVKDYIEGVNIYKSGMADCEEFIRKEHILRNGACVVDIEKSSMRVRNFMCGGASDEEADRIRKLYSK